MTVQSVLHFAEQRLDFSGKPALHLVYGANEAGKSTLLQLLVDLLFGGRVEEASRDLYQSRSRLFATITQDGQPDLQIARRRVRAQLLLANAAEQTLSEEILQPYLRGMTRERYQLLFGFDHERLRLGGESLLAADGHAGISLFEAGGGVQVLQGALTALDERLDRLVDPSFRGNSRRLLNVAWRSYKEAVAAVRAAGLRPDDWLALREEVTALEGQVAQWRSEQHDLDAALARVRRVQRVRLALLERGRLQERLQAYADVPVLMRAWETRIPEAIDWLRQRKEELSLREREYEALLRDRAAIQTDPAIIEHEDALRNLYAWKEEYAKMLQEIPLLQQKVADLQAQAALILRDVAPDIELPEADRLRVPLSQEERLLSVAQQWQRAHDQRQEGKERYQEAQEDLARFKAALHAMADVSDVTPLRRLLTQARSWGDVDAALSRALHEWSETFAAARVQWSRQNICQLPVEDALRLTMPLMTTVDEYVAKWTGMARDDEQRQRILAEASAETAGVNEQLGTLELAGHVPVEADLAQARATRQDGWLWIKRVWLQGVLQETATFGDGLPLDSAYEQAVQRADEIADRLRREADRSALRAQLLARRTKLAAVRENVLVQQRLADDERAAFWDAWQREWSSFAAPVKTPPEMKEWLQEIWKPVTEKLERVQEGKRVHAELVQQRQTWLSQVSHALVQAKQTHTALFAQVSADLLPLVEWTELVDSLETIVLMMEEKQRERRQSEQRVQESQTRLAQWQRKQEGLDVQFSDCQKTWQELTALFPALPPHPASATRYLGRLRELFHTLDEHSRASAAVNTKEQARRRFAHRVSEIASAVGVSVDTTEHSIESLVVHLHSRMTAAKEAAGHLADMTTRSELCSAELARLRDQQDTLLSELTHYQEHVQVCDWEALLQVVERSVERRRLQDEQMQLDQQIAIAGDGLTREELEAEVASVLQDGHMDSLDVQIAQLLERKDVCNARIDEAAQQLGARKDRLQMWDGSQSAAAAKAQEAEYHLAEVDRLWQDYVRAALAKKLLERGVEMFREQTESMILGQASALFARLTRDRYKELSVEYEDATPYLHAVTAEGSARRMNQLSDGTRDQVHLALRLAFVLQHMTTDAALPLIMDDILIHFDDDRAAATLEVLLELSAHTQIIYFTHHRHIAAMMLRLAGSEAVRLHELGTSPALVGRARIQ